MDLQKLFVLVPESISSAEVVETSLSTNKIYFCSATGEIIARGHIFGDAISPETDDRIRDLEEIEIWDEYDAERNAILTAVASANPIVFKSSPKEASIVVDTPIELTLSDTEEVVDTNSKAIQDIPANSAVTLTGSSVVIQ